MKEMLFSALREDHPWRERVQYFEIITSTNDVLKQMAQQGAPHGTVLVADCQTGGRGRLGRTFLSPPDTGIYMSVLLRPDCFPTQLMHLTCAAANAACAAISAALHIQAGIKWTNDIVIEKRKISGILTEMGLNQNGRVSWAVIGIGVNCNQQLEDFPEEIQHFAGSLRMICGAKIDRGLLAAHMIDAFYQMDKELISGKEEILNSYRKNCITIGQDVSVVKGESVRHGTAIGVDGEGALVVRFPEGIEAVNSGEVSVRGLYHYV